MSMSPTHAPEEAIREKAYYLWEADGKPYGRDQEYWQRAAVALSSKARLDSLVKPAPKKAKPEPAKSKAAASKSGAAPTKAQTAKKKPKKK
ncbi:MAG: DUF2934 domain-containing protein [Devosia sp.]